MTFLKYSFFFCFKKIFRYSFCFVLFVCCGVKIGLKGVQLFSQIARSKTLETNDIIVEYIITEELVTTDEGRDYQCSVSKHLQF